MKYLKRFPGYEKEKAIEFANQVGGFIKRSQHAYYYGGGRWRSLKTVDTYYVYKK